MAGFLAVLLLALVIASAIVVSAIGVDFGHHWDEGRILRSVRYSAQTGVLLPGWYNYPSLTYDIALWAAVPTVVDVARTDGVGEEATQQIGARVASALESRDYALTVRIVLAVLAAFAAIPTHLLTTKLTSSRWAGVAAAAVLLSSFEYGYHARWIAPDALLAAVVVAGLWAQREALEPRAAATRVRWLVIASMIAGLAIGTKYPAGLILLPLVIAAAGVARDTWGTRRAVTGCVIGAVAVAFGVFIITTPGTLIDPLRFVRDVVVEVNHYRGGHGGYTVGTGPEHLYLMFVYLVGETLSPFTPVAIVLALVAVYGAVTLVRDDRAGGWWFLSLPLAYVAYMSTQRVMIVRNYLLLIPLLAVLVGVGLAAVARRLGPSRVAGFVLSGLLVAAVLANGAYALDAARSVTRPPGEEPATAVRAFVAAAQTGSIALSPEVSRLVSGGGKTRTVPADRAQTYVYDSAEVEDWTLLPSNVPGRYTSVWAERSEVNWDYYPSWMGSRRILAVDIDEDTSPLVEALEASAER